MRHKPHIHGEDRVPCRRPSIARTFLLGARAVRKEESRESSELIRSKNKAKMQNPTETSTARQENGFLTLSENTGFFPVNDKQQIKSRIRDSGMY